MSYRKGNGGTQGRFKLTKFELSQQAHDRLNVKAHLEGRNKYSNYHAMIIEIQRNVGRIIPRSEREKVFKEFVESDNL